MCCRYFLLIIFAVNFIAGCTTMNSKFTCKTPDGVMCRSLDDVNGMVDRGEFNQHFVKSENIKNTVDFSRVGASAAYPAPVRDGESVMRIWITPYEDNRGNYHADSFLYTVVKPNRWVGIPPQEIVDLD